MDKNEFDECMPSIPRDDDAVTAMVNGPRCHHVAPRSYRLLADM
ncbi:hypothetical protein [Rhizobium ruizarguesonis]|nr:hypothetical protein [Rhizobium ruizarguesonis]